MAFWILWMDQYRQLNFLPKLSGGDSLEERHSEELSKVQVLYIQQLLNTWIIVLRSFGSLRLHGMKSALPTELTSMSQKQLRCILPNKWITKAKDLLELMWVIGISKNGGSGQLKGLFQCCKTLWFQLYFPNLKCSRLSLNIEIIPVDFKMLPHL